MKKRTNLLKFIAVFACLLFLATAATAQRRRTPRKSTANTTSAVATNTADIKAGAEKVATQIKNLTKFIYILGGVAQGIQDIDNDARTGKASRTAIDQNGRNKQAVVTTIKNLRAGLAALEVEFRTNPALKNYLFQIQGISDTTGEAEDQATNGQFNDAGKTLLQVVEKLTDTLAALP